MSQPMQPPAVASVIQELRQAQTLVEQVTVSLENQRTILKQRGVTLPQMVFQTLSDIKRQLNQLEATVIEEQTELGQLRALADMSASVNTSLDVDKVLEDAIDIVIALTRAERGFVILLDENGEYQYRVSREDALNPSKTSGTGKADISTSVLKEVIETGQALLASNAIQDERFQERASISRLTLRSVLCVPLKYKDNIIGAVYVDNRLQAGVFSEREKNTLVAFANTAAVAIANAQLYSDIQRLLQEITRVKDLMDNVFASVGSGIIATDAADMITTFNRAASDILDVQADDAVGASLKKVLPRLTADISEHLERIREQSESETIDTEIMGNDQERRALLLRLSPLRDDNEQIRGVAVVMDDVTDLREREQQLRLLKTYLPPEMVDQIHVITQLDLGGVRREITCLFADVRPISTMKDIPPKEVMDIINQYLSIASDCIHQTNGVVDKYSGTEIMALWNTQLSPQEHHADLALQCALMMRERFTEVYRQLGIDPNKPYYSIGVHSGVATLGNVGSLNRRDFTALGDSINLSHRLLENAQDGEIIASREAIEALTDEQKNQYDLESRPAIQVKGRQQQTEIYEVSRSS